MTETETKKWELAEDDPLWFLKHNPRAYGEVKDLVKKYYEALNPDGITRWNTDGPDEMQTLGKRKALKELLNILEKDML